MSEFTFVTMELTEMNLEDMKSKCKYVPFLGFETQNLLHYALVL